MVICGFHGDPYRIGLQLRPGLTYSRSGAMHAAYSPVQSDTLLNTRFSEAMGLLNEMGFQATRKLCAAHMLVYRSSVMVPSHSHSISDVPLSVE